MKTATIERETHASSSEKKAFTISNNAKIMRILINSIYADKYQSITREIWSNALDAHVEAGCPKRPFIVEFPSLLDQTFYVRDFGPGLSHDDVMSLYTSLGASTKEDSNDVIGKFGIGSKSPFAYTDNFTVMSYHNGELRSYSAMVGRDGVPEIHHMGTQATEEENGLAVSFPVHTNDIAAFTQAAKRVSLGFDVKPILQSGNEGNWPEYSDSVKGNGWRFLRVVPAGMQTNVAYARMGPVLYPMRAQSMQNLTYDQEALLKANLVIDFPMGSLEITASREELQYGRDDPTEDSIKNRLNEVAAEVEKMALAGYAKADSFYEACVAFTADRGDNNLPFFVKNQIRQKAKWRGTTLASKLVLYSGNYTTFTHYPAARMHNRTYRSSGKNAVEIVPTDGLIVFYEDMTGKEPLKGAAKRVKQYIDNLPKHPKQFLWVTIYDMHKSKDTLANCMWQLDGAVTVNLADIPLPEKVKRTPNRGGTTERRPVMARTMESTEFKRTVFLTPEEFDKGGVFVPLENMKPIVPMGCNPPYTVTTRLGALKDYPTVYGAPKSMWKKFEGPQWVNLYDYAREFFHKQNVDVRAVGIEQLARDRATKNDETNLASRLFDRGGIPLTSPIADVAGFMDRVRAVPVRNAVALEALAASVDILLPPAPISWINGDLAEMLTLLDTNYPLLRVIVEADVSIDDILLDKLTDYVIMCDAVRDNDIPVAIAA